ncbi:AcrR family transcriptional regulator [Pedobacter sp. UYP24]
MKKDKDASTEEKIIEAARKVFTQKGYAATRTRDIAEESGLNLALLNYYFRSKEKLFEIIMAEKVVQLFGTIGPIVNNMDTTLEKKASDIADAYITMLVNNPGLPLFVLSEIRNNPQMFGDKIHAGKLLTESYFVKQIQERRPDINPLHLMLNLLGMSIFPFICQPVLEAANVITGKAFESLVAERKNLIGIWFNALLEA